jgi:hypothetical protein
MTASGCEKTQPDIRSEETGLFNVAVGEKFPIQPLFESSSDSRIPVNQFRAPVAKTSPIKFLVDFEVAVNKEDEKVSYVRAMRAFAGLEECSEAMKSLSALAGEKYALKVTDKQYAGFVAESGDILVEIHCSIPEGSPYHQLDFMLSSKSQRAILQEKYKALTTP